MLLMLVVVIIGDYRAVPGVTVVAGEDLLGNDPVIRRISEIGGIGIPWLVVVIIGDYRPDSHRHRDIEVGLRGGQQLLPGPRHHMLHRCSPVCELRLMS